MFDDDCLPYRPIKADKDHVVLKKDIESLMQLASSWGMTFNTAKFNIGYYATTQAERVTDTVLLNG